MKMIVPVIWMVCGAYASLVVTAVEVYAGVTKMLGTMSVRFAQ
jgi:hypothetical protein